MGAEIETMIAGAVILTISLLLFVYWFRYTCNLMLRAKPARDLTERITVANKLKFQAVQSQLNEEIVFAPTELDRLFQSLNRDHRIITYLMKYGARYRSGGLGAEHLILELDYKLMMAIYRITRNSHNGKALQALREMAGVLSYFTNAMGASLGGDAMHAALPE